MDGIFQFGTFQIPQTPLHIMHRRFRRPALLCCLFVTHALLDALYHIGDLVILTGQKQKTNTSAPYHTPPTPANRGPGAREAAGTYIPSTPGMVCSGVRRPVVARSCQTAAAGKREEPYATG